MIREDFLLDLAFSLKEIVQWLFPRIKRQGIREKIPKNQGNKPETQVLYFFITVVLTQEGVK